METQEENVLTETTQSNLSHNKTGEKLDIENSFAHEIEKIAKRQTSRTKFLLESISNFLYPLMAVLMGGIVLVYLRTVNFDPAPNSEDVMDLLGSITIIFLFLLLTIMNELRTTKKLNYEILTSTLRHQEVLKRETILNSAENTEIQDKKKYKYNHEIYVSYNELSITWLGGFSNSLAELYELIYTHQSNYYEKENALKSYRRPFFTNPNDNLIVNYFHTGDSFKIGIGLKDNASKNARHALTILIFIMTLITSGCESSALHRETMGEFATMSNLAQEDDAQRFRDTTAYLSKHTIESSNIDSVTVVSNR